MKQILIHPLYLAPVPIYSQMYTSQKIIIDDVTPFVKQTYRNRCIIATENGTQQLTIPIIHNGQQAMRDVRISEHGNWRHLHWNAITSAYRKSPYFDYYADDFAHFYEERDGFLIDYNIRMQNLTCELLGLKQTIELLSETGNLGNNSDLRTLSEPANINNIANYTPQRYYQVFSNRNGFIANLSIADLLFNMGPEGLLVLRDSITPDSKVFT